ncbi:hypothetical protein [Brevundimonas denitrificans]|uniref:hypothetical protein n=1 Tax=Brevundimonas denitrificans TaxID=1443434 RepID=UPI00223C2C17|nr:hypothetical protein [Brevundimonas denitrificans]
MRGLDPAQPRRAQILLSAAAEILPFRSDYLIEMGRLENDLKITLEVVALELDFELAGFKAKLFHGNPFAPRIKRCQACLFE